MLKLLWFASIVGVLFLPSGAPIVLSKFAQAHIDTLLWVCGITLATKVIGLWEFKVVGKAFAAVSLLLAPFIFLFINPAYVGRYIISAGGLLNMLVVFANGISMPVNWKAKNAYDPYMDLRGIYVYEAESTRLRWLCDRLHLRWILGNGVMSIGDVLLYLGAVSIAVQAHFFS